MALPLSKIEDMYRYELLAITGLSKKSLSTKKVSYRMLSYEDLYKLVMLRIDTLKMLLSLIEEHNIKYTFFKSMFSNYKYTDQSTYDFFIGLFICDNVIIRESSHIGHKKAIDLIIRYINEKDKN